MEHLLGLPRFWAGLQPVMPSSERHPESARHPSFCGGGPGVLCAPEFLFCGTVSCPSRLLWDMGNSCHSACYHGAVHEESLSCWMTLARGESFP